MKKTEKGFEEFFGNSVRLESVTSISIHKDRASLALRILSTVTFCVSVAWVVVVGFFNEKLTPILAELPPFMESTQIAVIVLCCLFGLVLWQYSVAALDKAPHRVRIRAAQQSFWSRALPRWRAEITMRRLQKLLETSENVAETRLKTLGEVCTSRDLLAFEYSPPSLLENALLALYSLACGLILFYYLNEHIMPVLGASAYDDLLMTVVIGVLLFLGGAALFIPFLIVIVLCSQSRVFFSNGGSFRVHPIPQSELDAMDKRNNEAGKVLPRRSFVLNMRDRHTERFFQINNELKGTGNTWFRIQG